ncbi:MAG: hypothetical protein AABZ57_05845, partial [Candidatus Margulisiibacteriota bacterium]
MAKIISIAHANPDRCLTQQELWGNLNILKKLSPMEKKFYKKFMLNEGIEKRYLALDDIKDIFCEDQDLIIARYSQAAAKLSSMSSQRAVNKAGIGKERIGCVVTASCTGYLCPGLSSYIIEKTGLRPDVSVFDLQGMGCGAALPALSAGAGYLASSRDNSCALITCTEICSAAVYWDSDPGLILSNSIFADGSASVVLSPDQDAAGLDIIDYCVINLPQAREALRFKIDKGKLRNVLSKEVPQIVSKAVKAVVGALLEKNSLRKEEVKYWAIHSGG